LYISDQAPGVDGFVSGFFSLVQIIEVTYENIYITQKRFQKTSYVSDLLLMTLKFLKKKIHHYNLNCNDRADVCVYNHVML